MTSTLKEFGDIPIRSEDKPCSIGLAHRRVRKHNFHFESIHKGEIMGKNKELMKRMVHCFNNLDADGLSPIITDEVKHTAGGSAFGADIEGRGDFMTYIRESVLAKFTSVHFDTYNVFEDQEKSAVIAEWRGDFILKNGRSFSSKGVFITDIKDGKIDWVRDYFDTEKTKQATG